MNTHGLPNGIAVDMDDSVACLVWANYFSHAQAGMGLRITLEGVAYGHVQVLRMESVYAPLYGAMDVRVNLDGSDFCDCSEQSPLMITLDECRALVQGPPQWRVTWLTHAKRLAASAATAWQVS